MVLARISRMTLDLMLASAIILAVVLAVPMSFWNGLEPTMFSLTNLGMAIIAVSFVAVRYIRREGQTRRTETVSFGSLSTR